MKAIGIVIAWTMLAALALLLLLVPQARHADRQGKPGLLHDAVNRLRRLTLSALLGLSAVFIGSVAHSGKTNHVQNLPPQPMLQLPAPQQPLPQSPAPAPSILDYPRTITDSRVAAGIALVGVGTNETFTFDPPANAVVCDDWRMYGSSTRWTHVASTNFAFPFGGTNVSTFTFVPGGVMYVTGGGPAAASNNVAPFRAKMGIAPERLWSSIGVTSRLWTATSPSNTFLATWQGAFLGCSTNNPVDVQLELFPDGGFDCRYDLSHLPPDADLSSVRVGAVSQGYGEVYSVPHRNLTSARWRPVLPEDLLDPDRDHDGVTTVDELFFLGTDPGNPDSDFDGLPDGQELTLGLTPLDPYSNGGPYPDGFAVALGNENPLASPPDSSYTIYEHIVYSGTTNGVVSAPASTAAFALLEVDVSGTGTGDLVVGMQSLPLLGGAPTVYLPVPRGDRLAVRLRRRTGSLSLSLDSEDFAIGEMPGLMGGDPTGWISFPRTAPVPEVACIHDLYGRTVRVRLEPGYGEEDLSCLWWGTSAVAASNHADNLSATLTGNFDAHCTARVMYTLEHPHRLFGMGSYWQSVRFCPRPSDASDEPVDDPWDNPWYEPDPTNPGPYDDLYGGDGESPGTHPTPCDCCLSCPLKDGAGCIHHPPAPPEVSEPAPPNPSSPCPVHNCPYSECADLHGDAAPRTAWVPFSTHVLKVGRMPTVDEVALTVPEGAVNCCPCPDHWTNWVGVAHLPDHVSVKGGDGLDFWKSETDCSAYVSGISPTRLSERASLAFATNGTIHIRRNYMVFGVDVDTPNHTAARLNARNPTFGVPVTVCTNASRAAGIDLVTRVRLAAGAVTLTAGDGAFKVWLDRSNQGRPPLLLVDGESRPTVTMSLAKWRSLAGLTGDEDEARTRVYLTSATPGTRTLTFSFSAGGELNDAVVQRITFVTPPLRLDVTRDGSIDDGDVAANLAGRTFYFWTNEDFWKGDDAFAGEDRALTNSLDMVVNGRNDLINLLPVAVDVSPFISAWGNAATFRIRGSGFVRYAAADVDWGYADQLHLDDCLTTDGLAIRAAPLTALSDTGMTLGGGERSLSSGSSLTLLLEASQPCSNPVELVVEVGGTAVFSYVPSLCFGRVRNMYRWYNRRYVAEGEVTDGDRPGNPTCWPDSERDGGANGPMLVFVHGYNVAEWEARAWSDGVFKRLWWSGMNAKFTAVAWRGDEGQVYFPSQGLITPDYQVNVEHAFATAPALATLLNGLPGDKYILAHSLGNMLVSSAIQDHGLLYAKYFLLNAAVPVEAYDAVNGVTAESKAGMTHPEWVGYSDRVRASHWWELFPAGDGRRALTWKGLFANITNTVNYYSSEEEVLADGNGTVPNFPRRDHAWSDQELWKGNKPFTDLIFYSMGRNEGGWSFNSDHDVYEQPPGNLPSVLRRRTPDETTNLTDAVLRECPFFGHFGNRNIYTSTNGTIVSESIAYRAQLLADAIPAESFAVGANAVPSWNGNGCVNVNMVTEFKDDKQFYKSPSQDWIHSFFLKVPYMCIHAFYEDVVSRIPKENSNE